MQLSIIDYLLILALLTAALYTLSAALLRWLHTPVGIPEKRKESKPVEIERRRFTNTASMRQDAALHAFSR